MTTKRICANTDCTTILSRFNDTDYCSAHSQPTPFDPKEWFPEDNKRPLEKIGGLPLRKDQAAYMKAYRIVKPAYAQRNRGLVNARNAAARKVASLHPEEFEAALMEECESRGIF